MDPDKLAGIKDGKVVAVKLQATPSLKDFEYKEFFTFRQQNK